MRQESSDKAPGPGAQGLRRGSMGPEARRVSAKVSSSSCPARESPSSKRIVTRTGRTSAMSSSSVPATQTRPESVNACRLSWYVERRLPSASAWATRSWSGPARPKVPARGSPKPKVSVRPWLSLTTTRSGLKKLFETASPSRTAKLSVRTTPSYSARHSGSPMVSPCCSKRRSG